VLEVHDHHVVPQAQALEVAHQVVVDDGELTRQVGLDRQVAEAGLDGGVHTNDVGDGGRGGDGHAVGVAHAVRSNLLAQRVPVQGGGPVHFHVAATGLGQQVQGVQRQDALVPQRALVAGVLAALAGQLGRGPVGVVAHGFHGLVGELHGLLRGIGNAQLVQRVLEAHDTQTHRAVAQVGVARLLDGVVVDVDHVVEHAHRRGDGALELVLVDLAVLQVLQQVDRAQVADGGFLSLVLSVISVHRLDECTTPACCCGLRTLQASLKVIQGWPVSNSMVSILRHRSAAGTVLLTA
jgi:hypothetical protein